MDEQNPVVANSVLGTVDILGAFDFQLNEGAIVAKSVLNPPKVGAAKKKRGLQDEQMDCCSGS